MSTRDPLLLQSLLFSAVRALGGTWQPAPCVFGDVAIQCKESTALPDGSTMTLTVTMTACGINDEQPRMHLSHFVGVTSVGMTAVPPYATASAIVKCAFKTIDDVLDAYNVTTANINDRAATLIAGLEASREC